MIKIIWLGVVICGIANGLVYSFVASPDRYIYMSVIALLCLGIIIFHDYHTRNWHNNRDYDEERTPVFNYSALAICGFLIVTLICDFHGASIAGFTVLLSFMAMSNRESMYTGKAYL